MSQSFGPTAAASAGSAAGTARPGRRTASAWSSDGRRLAAVFCTRPPTRTEPELVNSTVGSPSWSPDGRHLVGSQVGELDVVTVVDLGSGDKRTIYTDEGIGYPTLSDPAWSPD